MRRLRDFQIVLLQAAEIRVTCCAVATGGDDAVLEPRTARDVANLRLPLRCELIFDRDHHPVMLSGMADSGPVAGTLRFWVTDDVAVRELRLRPRLTSAFDALVTPLDGAGRATGPPVLRAPRDVSAGGAFLAGHAAPAGGRR
jgi:hypothetical protein